MAILTLDEVTKITGGDRLRGRPECRFTAYSIDSRTLRPGELFIALRGPNFDGTDYVPEAVEKGAAGVLVMEPPDLPGSDGPAIIRVNDTLAALHKLAAHIRGRKRLRVVGITGSTGKTTTKEMLVTLLKCRYRTSYSRGNLNNLYGLPLSFLRMKDDAEVMVCEMGMSSRGEIKKLAAIAAPDMGVITNIYPVHLEFFSSVREIAQAKKELLDGMDPDGTAVFNQDNPLTREITADFPGKKISFSLEGLGDYTASQIRSLGIDGTAFRVRSKSREGAFRISLTGKHHVANALAALAAASELGAPWEKMETALAGLLPMEGRGRIIPTENGFHIIDDSYNSNPAALSQAAAMLAGMACRGKKILAAGDMRELGSEAPARHREAGKEIAGLGIDILVGVGELAAEICGGALAAGMPESQVFQVVYSEEAVPLLQDLLVRGDIVLIKGSRAVGMDVIIKALSGKACLRPS